MDTILGSNQTWASRHMSREPVKKFLAKSARQIFFESNFKKPDFAHFFANIKKFRTRVWIRFLAQIKRGLQDTCLENL